jgi:hypothetical protein
MPQLQLPIFPAGSVVLTPELAVVCTDGQVTYFHGSLPVFRHRVEDVRSFRLIASQLYLNGHVKQADLVRVFGVSAISLKRAVKVYEQKGPGGFWEPRRPRGPSVLTLEVLRAVQGDLDGGQELSAVARARSLNYSTLTKAVQAGRLHRAVKKTRPAGKRN